MIEIREVIAQFLLNFDDKTRNEGTWRSSPATSPENPDNIKMFSTPLLFLVQQISELNASPTTHPR